MWFDTGEVLGYSQLGVAMDISEDAKKNGYGLENTYPGVAGLLCGMDGRQYAYPCNSACDALWINLSTLKKFGFDRPPLEWTPEEFEKMGSNTSGKRTRDFRGRSIFFCRRWTAPGVWRWRCASPAAAGLTSTTKP